MLEMPFYKKTTKYIRPNILTHLWGWPVNQNGQIVKAISEWNIWQPTSQHCFHLFSVDWSDILCSFHIAYAFLTFGLCFSSWNNMLLKNKVTLINHFWAYSADLIGICASLKNKIQCLHLWTILYLFTQPLYFAHCCP